MRRLLSNPLGLLGLLLATAAQAELLETSTHENVVYFADDQSTQVQRYSLTDESFLTPITLSYTPKAIHVDDAGIYVSYGTEIVKLELDGSDQAAVRTADEVIIDIEANDKYLFLGGEGYLEVVDRTQNTLVDIKPRYSGWSSVGNFTLAPNGEFIYTTAGRASSKAIHKVMISTDGHFDDSTTTLYNSTYDVGTQTYLFPSGNRIIDNSGNLYNTGTLSHVTNLGGAFTALDFWQGLPVVLRNGHLYGYNLLRESGNVALPNNVNFSQLVVYENKAFVFGLDNANQLISHLLDINQLNLSTTPPPVDPTNLPYTPDEIALDADQDTIYLLSKSKLSIFRWSISQGRYLDTIPLADAPIAFAYSSAHGRIYLTYHEGQVNYIDPVTNVETLFVNSEQTSRKLVAAGEFLITANVGYSWYSFLTLNKAGNVVGHQQFIGEGKLVWSPASKGIYYSDGYNLYVEPLAEDGTFGAKKRGWIWEGTAIDPIRISENGKFVALGTGLILSEYNSEHYWMNGFNQEANVNPGDNFTDLTWLHGNLFTIKGIDSNSSTQLDRWNGDFSEDTNASLALPGAPFALLPLSQAGKLVVVALQNGKPSFETLSYTERDFDGDGVFDSEDLFPANASETTDIDRDGTGDNSDLDDDGDKVLDTKDAFPKDRNESLDTDNDGVGNNTDTDDDNDNVADSADAFPIDPKESEDLDKDGVGNNADIDSDGDRVDNIYDELPLNPNERTDWDKDGIGDKVDPDRDNDGVANDDDAFPYDPTETKDSDWDATGDNTDPDLDGDNVNNQEDMFPLNRSETLDNDKDGIGNHADLDDDNDGAPDTEDRFPLDARDSKDSDNDGTGDSIDSDRDGDTINNDQDAFPSNSKEWLDTDKDGTGNVIDLDDDNDGISDLLDYQPLDASKSALQAAAYLPLVPGNQWTYAGLDKPVIAGETREIEGQTITPLVFPSGSQIYLKVVDNQVRFYGLYLPGVWTNYGRFSLDFSLDKGVDILTNSYLSGNGSVNIYPTYGKRNLSWTMSVLYLGSESIIVPAGQYTALHTRIIFSGSANVDGVPVSTTYWSDYWFADGIGLVKISESGNALDLVSSKITMPVEPGTSNNSGNNGGSSGGGSSGGGGGSTSLFLLVLLGLSLSLRKKS